MTIYRLLVIVPMLVSASVFAETPNVQDFRVVYRQDAGVPAAQETLRGAQRALELQSAAGELITLRRTLKNGTHEMRASHARTRAQAWALAEKLKRSNPDIGSVEPIDPDAERVHGNNPIQQGGAK